jgi:hypothetical protein
MSLSPRQAYAQNPLVQGEDASVHDYMRRFVQYLAYSNLGTTTAEADINLPSVDSADFDETMDEMLRAYKREVGVPQPGPQPPWSTTAATECVREYVLRVQSSQPAATDLFAIDAALRSRIEDINSSLSELLGQNLVERVRGVLAEGSRSRALDVVYAELDRKLLAGDLATCEAALVAAARSDLPLSILVGYLTITLPWRKALGSAREELVNVVRQMAFAAGGNAKVAAVLGGLT